MSRNCTTHSCRHTHPPTACPKLHHNHGCTALSWLANSLCIAQLWPASPCALQLAVLVAAAADSVCGCWLVPAAPQVMAVMQPAVEFYCRELVRVVQFLGDIFSRSPFLVTSDQVQAAAAGAGSAVVGGAQQRASRTSMEVGAGVDAVTATVNKGLADHHQKPRCV